MTAVRMLVAVLVGVGLIALGITFGLRWLFSAEPGA